MIKGISVVSFIAIHSIADLNFMTYTTSIFIGVSGLIVGLVLSKSYYGEYLYIKCLSIATKIYLIAIIYTFLYISFTSLLLKEWIFRLQPQTGILIVIGTFYLFSPIFIECANILKRINIRISPYLIIFVIFLITVYTLLLCTILSRTSPLYPFVDVMFQSGQGLGYPILFWISAGLIGLLFSDILYNQQGSFTKFQINISILIWISYFIYSILYSYNKIMKLMDLNSVCNILLSVSKYPPSIMYIMLFISSFLLIINFTQNSKFIGDKYIYLLGKYSIIAYLLHYSIIDIFKYKLPYIGSDVVFTITCLICLVTIIIYQSVRIYLDIDA
jgi:hypothetical protein